MCHNIRCNQDHETVNPSVKTAQLCAHPYMFALHKGKLISCKPYCFVSTGVPLLL